jgi:hypothetical protein
VQAQATYGAKCRGIIAFQHTNELADCVSLNTLPGGRIDLTGHGECVAEAVDRYNARARLCFLLDFLGGLAGGI